MKSFALIISDMGFYFTQKQLYRHLAVTRNRLTIGRVGGRVTVNALF